jgi:hypothetical protein
MAPASRLAAAAVASSPSEPSAAKSEATPSTTSGMCIGPIPSSGFRPRGLVAPIGIRGRSCGTQPKLISPAATCASAVALRVVLGPAHVRSAGTAWRSRGPVGLVVERRSFPLSRKSFTYLQVVVVVHDISMTSFQCLVNPKSNVSVKSVRWQTDASRVSGRRRPGSARGRPEQGIPNRTAQQDRPSRIGRCGSARRKRG